MRRRVVELADQLRGLARTGLHFSEGPYDRERYETLLEIAAELGSLATGSPADAMLDLYRRSDDGYVTPKLDVRAAVFRGEAVLMVRERSDGLWSLPGGYVDIGDTPSEAAQRETLEEASLEVRVERLAGCFDNRAYPECPPHLFHIHKLVFSARALDDRAEPAAGPEASEVGYWPVDALPDLSLGRTLPLHVREAWRVARDPHALPWLD